MKLATLCYIQTENKTLMINKNKNPNKIHYVFYNGIGGKFEFNESPEDCAVREVKEETGFNVEELNYKGIITFPALEKEQEDWYVFVYTVTKYSGTQIDNSNNVEGNLEWVETKNLLNLKIHEGDKIFIPWLNDPQIFSAKFIYDKEKLLNYIVNFY